MTMLISQPAASSQFGLLLLLTQHALPCNPCLEPGVAKELDMCSLRALPRKSTE